jgi:ribosome maturation factor RimP
MPRPEVTDAVRAICESVLADRGVELVTCTLGRGESGGQALSLTIDRDNKTVSLDEIVEISGELSRALDEQDPIPGRYALEVASAGIERPLVRAADYRRFQGARVKVRCEAPIEGQRVFSGTIRSAGDESFVLDAEDRTTVEIPFAAVARARLVADWQKELKGLRGAPERSGEPAGP